jgi:PAS domain S-box-containing protein
MHGSLRQLLDDYLRMYASRDDRLTGCFSANFSGFTGGGAFLVKDLAEWVAITRQDFAQVKEPLRLELRDVSLQPLTDDVAVATSFFTIHLPIPDHVLSRETARLVLIFRREAEGWKIVHSSISIPYNLVQEGEVYPLKNLTERNRALEELVAERTAEASEANARLRRTNEQLAREMAEREQTAAALQQSEELYRSILNASPDDITITDREGRIVMLSPAARAIFGFERDEQGLGRLVTDFIVPEDRDRAMAQVRARLQGISSGPAEYVGLRADGSPFDIEVNSDFIRDATGGPTGMVVIVRDITQRKQAEAERCRLEAQNRQLQKAESLGRMASAIAHHFNNQLQSVLMGLDFAMADVPPHSPAAEALLVAAQSARKAAEMSRLMLTYLGHSAAARAALDLSRIWNQELTALRAVLPSSVALVSDSPAVGPLVVEADPQQIRTILTNLVVNAGEAAGAGAAAVRLRLATVGAGAIPPAHRFPVEGQPQTLDYACLEVADEGCGIPETDIDKIFDPFFSSKFPGRGMGLAVVLGLVRALDGFVTVRSCHGRGSTFRVYLPLVANPASAVP